MKKLWLIVIGACLLGLAAPSSTLAQGKKGNKANKPKAKAALYDLNRNGVLDADEKEAIRKAFETLKAFDTNNDGTLSDDELNAIKLGRNANKEKANKGGKQKKNK